MTTQLQTVQHVYTAVWISFGIEIELFSPETQKILRVNRLSGEQIFDIETARQTLYCRISHMTS